MRFTQDAIDLGAWSYSKALMAYECPHQFVRKYVHKQKTPREDVSSNLVLGSALHSALEYITLGHETEGALEQAKIDVAKERDSRPLTANEVEEFEAYRDRLDNYKTMIEAYKKKFGVTRKNIAVEQRVGITIDRKRSEFFGRNVFFRGVVDLWIHLPGNRIMVLDHKRRGSADLTKYDAQLKIYAVVLKSLYPDTVSVTGGIHLLETEQRIWAPTYSAEQIEDELVPWYVNWINGAAEASKTNTINITHRCGWCPYKDLGCKAERQVRRAAFKAGTIPETNIIERNAKE